MKKALICLFLTTTALGYSQVVVEEIYGYQKIFEVPETSATEIHSLIEQWIGNNFDAPDEAIQFNETDKIVIQREFKMSPKIIQTFQNTTTKYVVSSGLTFLIKEGKFRVDMRLDDLYSFDGKKAEPKSTFNILKNEIDNEFINVLLSNGYLNVKQFRNFLALQQKGDAKAKKAEKYTAKEIKKGVYLSRMKKVAQDLNTEVEMVFNSIDQHFKTALENNW